VSVKAEVERRVRTRERLYSAILTHIQSGGRLRDFPAEAYSRHDADRARELLRQLRGNDADLEYKRLLIIDLRARIRAAFQRLETPLIERSGDAYFEDQLRLLVGLQRGDAGVASDYLHWASGRFAPAAFLSGDAQLVDGLTRLPTEFLEQKFGNGYRNFSFENLREFRA